MSTSGTDTDESVASGKNASNVQNVKEKQKSGDKSGDKSGERGGEKSGGRLGRDVGLSEAERMQYTLTEDELRVVRRQFELVIEINGGLLEAGIAWHHCLTNVASQYGVLDLFVTPLKVIAFQFIRKIESIIGHADEPEACLVEIYNLAMKHTNYVKAEIFRIARKAVIHELVTNIKTTIDEEWGHKDEGTWTKMFDWISLNLVTYLEESGSKVILLNFSWKEISKLTEEDGGGGFGDALYFQLSVMSAEITALISSTREVVSKSFNRQFTVLVTAMSDPMVFNEEFFIMCARHVRYGVQEKNFPVFEQAIMVTLRSLVPAIWNASMEEAWAWFYQFMADTMITKLSEMNEYKEIVEDSTKYIMMMDSAQLGEDIYSGFFDLYPAASVYFSKNKRLVRMIIAKILEILLGVFRDSTTTVIFVRACGIRHIKYGIPQDYLFPFASYLVDCIGRTLEGYWQPIHTRAWISLCEFVANCMARAIQGGTTLVTRALVRDSVLECEDAIDQAPRCERVGWMLEVSVSGSRVSPFFWALQDTKFKVVEFMLFEILAIRADRNKYYCGKDDLFRIHPNLIKELAEANANILFLLFDGLMWESSKVENNRRRVNYFFKDLWGNPTLDMFSDVYKTPLSTLVDQGNSNIYSHPLLTTLIARQWDDFGKFMFTKFQSVYVLLLILFMVGNILVDRHYDEGHGNYQTKNTFAFVCRLAAAAISFFVLVAWQIPRLAQEYSNNQVRVFTLDLGFLFRSKKSTKKKSKAKEGSKESKAGHEMSDSDSGSGSSSVREEAGQATKESGKTKGKTFKELLHAEGDGIDADQRGGRGIIKIKVAMFFLEAFNCGRFILNVVILSNVVFDQNWDVHDSAIRAKMRHVMQAIGSALIWLLCLELWESSLDLLRLRQRCQFVAGHVLCTVLTICLSLITFAIAMWLSEPNEGFGHADFLYQDVGSSFTTLFSSLPGLMSVRVRDYSTQMTFFYMVFAVYSFTVLMRLLFGWLIVICIKTHEAMHEFAQMRRSATLVELDSRRSSASRRATWNALRLDERIEFDEGDLGLTGGIQINLLITDSKMQHDRKIGDRVVRYATACGDRLPWPKAAAKADFVEEGLQRFEAQSDNFRRDFKLFQRLMLQQQSTSSEQLQSLSMSEHSQEQDEE